MWKSLDEWQNHSDRRPPSRLNFACNALPISPESIRCTPEQYERRCSGLWRGRRRRCGRRQQRRDVQDQEVDSISAESARVRSVARPGRPPADSVCGARIVTLFSHVLLRLRASQRWHQHDLADYAAEDAGACRFPGCAPTYLCCAPVHPHVFACFCVTFPWLCGRLHVTCRFPSSLRCLLMSTAPLPTSSLA